MKALIVYFTKFGNTQQVAEAIAEALRPAMSVDLVHSGQLLASTLRGVDLVIMGSPTHNMNLPKDVRPVFASLPRRILKGLAVAAFDTSYKMSWWLNAFTAGKRLDRKLRKLGGTRVIPPEIFIVTGREGPLYDGELGRAQNWARKIRERLESLSRSLRREGQYV